MHPALITVVCLFLLGLTATEVHSSALKGRKSKIRRAHLQALPTNLSSSASITITSGHHNKLEESVQTTGAAFFSRITNLLQNYAIGMVLGPLVYYFLPEGTKMEFLQTALYLLNIEAEQCNVVPLEDRCRRACIFLTVAAVIGCLLVGRIILNR